jgi:polysaccharide export outer membrane protein
MKREGSVSLFQSPSPVKSTAVKWAGAITIAMSLALTGCQAPGERPGTLSASWRTAPSGPVVLTEGDTVKLYFPGAPEFSGVQKIRADGKLSLTGLGEIQGAGKTLLQLQADISARYRAQLQNPTVMVTLEASGSPITVTGGVMSPGVRLAPDRHTTLLEALLAAGGVNEESGNAARVRIVRLVNGRGETITVDMRGALRGEENTPIYLKPGDNIDVGQY